MAGHQEIVLDVAGTLTFDVPEGRPTGTPTVIVYTPGGATHVASASATVDAVNTTLQSAPAAGATSLTVASATGIARWRVYLVTNPSGQAEWVRVRAINSTTITIEEAIQYTHTTASTFVGVRLSTSITAAKATPRDDGYYAEWTYVFGGVTYKSRTYFDVVRSRWPEVMLQPWELKRYLGDRAADIRQRNEQLGDDFEQAVAVATEALRDDIESRDYKVAKFTSFEPFKRPAAFRVLLDWARLGYGVPESFDSGADWVRHCEELYERALTQALTICRVYDDDDTGVVSDAERAAHLGALRFVR